MRNRVIGAAVAALCLALALSSPARAQAPKMLSGHRAWIMTFPACGVRSPTARTRPKDWHPVRRRP